MKRVLRGLLRLSPLPHSQSARACDFLFQPFLLEADGANSVAALGDCLLPLTAQSIPQPLQSALIESIEHNVIAGLH